MTFWGIQVKPGKPYSLPPDNSKLRITQATLGLGSSEAKSLLQCNVGAKSPILLCSLIPDRVESCPLDLEFQETDEVVFSVIGTRSIHLAGYYLGSKSRDDSSESFGEDIGDSDTVNSNDGSDEDDDGFEMDSFIVDDEEELSEDEIVSTKNSKHKKPKRLKRLRKMREQTDSEDDNDYNPMNESLESDPNTSEAEDSKPNKNKRKKGSSEGLKNIESPETDVIKTENGCHDPPPDESQCDDKKIKKRKKTAKKKEDKVKDIEIASENQEIKSPGIDLADDDIEADQPKQELVIEELQEGSIDGAVACSGKKVTLHYVAKLKEGDHVYESTASGHPFKFRLGKGRAIDGLEVGIDGMRVGGKRRLTIPPELGYGTKGRENSVPPNSWLVYDVELVRVR